MVSNKFLYVHFFHVYLMVLVQIEKKTWSQRLRSLFFCLCHARTLTLPQGTSVLVSEKKHVSLPSCTTEQHWVAWWNYFTHKCPKPECTHDTKTCVQRCDKMWNVKFAMPGVECRKWGRAASLKNGVYGVDCRKCGAWSVDCGVECVKCGVLTLKIRFKHFWRGRHGNKCLWEFG